MQLFDNRKILTCLGSLVGLREEKEPCPVDLDPSVTASISGMYFNDAHELITVNNLVSCAPAVSAATFDPWDIATNYAAGKVVNYSGIDYVCNVDNVGIQPDINPAEWSVYNAFSYYIRNKINGFILNYINRVFSEKIGAKVQKNVLKDETLFWGLGHLNNKIVKNGRFMGLQFNPKNAENLSFIIHRLGIQTDMIQTGLKIYLYHSSQKEALQVFSFDVTKAISYQWFILAESIKLNWSTDDHDPGVFYLGYYEGDGTNGTLLGQAISKDHNFLKGCGTCANRRDYILQGKYQPYAEIMPIRVNSEYLNGVDMFDQEGIQIVNKSNNGLNAVISLTCDLSDLICRHSAALYEPIKTFVGYEMIKMMAYSTRMNRDKTEAAQLARFELKEGLLKDDVDRVIKQTTIDLSDLGAVCMPCEERNGITITAV